MIAKSLQLLQSSRFYDCKIIAIIKMIKAFCFILLGTWDGSLNFWIKFAKSFRPLSRYLMNDRSLKQTKLAYRFFVTIQHFFLSEFPEAVVYWDFSR